MKAEVGDFVKILPPTPGNLESGMLERSYLYELGSGTGLCEVVKVYSGGGIQVKPVFSGLVPEEVYNRLAQRFREEFIFVAADWAYEDEDEEEWVFPSREEVINNRLSGLQSQMRRAIRGECYVGNRYTIVPRSVGVLSDYV